MVQFFAHRKVPLHRFNRNDRYSAARLERKGRGVVNGVAVYVREFAVSHWRVVFSETFEVIDVIKIASRADAYS